ncbi:hypothetical protein [Clostridium tyrobutyricum]|uniref:hypothetical protein n=1 Tax=Clostridium tyrobutyricum TaxID=1519 RepID=UPI001C393844|nr:hypothetical protein [Clostridium tyrobutyricum]MBV4423162.1 hypothetical protein [Clostridium tyrobutyricum]
MNLGRRIIYDNQTGEILLDTGEQDNATEERPVWNGVTYIDIPYGQDTDKYSRVIKYHVDINNKTVVFDELSPIPITSQEQIMNLTKTIFNFNKAFTDSNKNAELVKAILDAINDLKATYEGSDK